MCVINLQVLKPQQTIPTVKSALEEKKQEIVKIIDKPKLSTSTLPTTMSEQMVA